MVIIINDVNDQFPEPLQKEPYEIEIEEETPQTLNFDTEFGFHDKDLVRKKYIFILIHTYIINSKVTLSVCDTIKAKLLIRL